MGNPLQGVQRWYAVAAMQQVAGRSSIDQVKQELFGSWDERTSHSPCTTVNEGIWVNVEGGIEIPWLLAALAHPPPDSPLALVYTERGSPNLERPRLAKFFEGYDTRISVKSGLLYWWEFSWRNWQLVYGHLSTRSGAGAVFPMTASSSTGPGWMTKLECIGGIG